MKEPNLPLKKKYFYRFLVQNNALFTYLQYFKFENPVFERVDWIYWLVFSKIGSLTWGMTKEGVTYWKLLQDLWVTCLMANNYFKINEK